MIEKILTKAWNNYKKNFAVLIGSFLISIIVPGIVVGAVGVVSFLPLILKVTSLGMENGLKSAISSNALLYLFIPLVIVFTTLLLVSPPFSYGFMHVIKLSRKRKVKIKMIFDGVKIFWKRAIAQQILALIFLFLASVPFIISAVNYVSPFYTKTNYASLFYTEAMPLELTAIIFLWSIAMLILGFLFMFWPASIVVYNVGVTEGLKRGMKKVSSNLLESLILILVIMLLSVATSALESIIPIVPTILIRPLYTSIIIEGCINLKEK